MKANDLEALVTLQGGEERRVDLQPRGRATLRGTVAFTAGAVPEVVALYLRPQRETPGHWPDGMRGGFAVNGRFEVTHLEPGTWSIGAQAVCPDGTSLFGSATVEVPPEGEVEAHVVIEPRK